MTTVAFLVLFAVFAVASFGLGILAGPIARKPGRGRR